MSTIGIDQQTGVARFAFDQLWLLDGVGFIVLTVALFGIGEVLSSVGKPMPAPITQINRVIPTREEWRRSRMPILRGSIIGFLVGVLPATGATIASFLAYIVEKKVSRHPQEFGKGAIEGRGRAGILQQRSGRGSDGPDAGARRTGLRHDRDHPRRAHHVRHPARPGAVRQERGAGLDGDRQHVHR